MFASTALCYMDRQAMALVRPMVKEEFRLTKDEEFGWVLGAFTLSYALFQVPAGFLADRGNLRWTYALAVAWWSLAGVAAAFAPSLGILMACRGLLGFGEAFNWPCALRGTATVLPPADRSLGSGIFNSGAAVGAILGPLTITPLARWFGWRAAFATVGVLGFGWVVAWLTLLGGSRSRLLAGRRAEKSPASDDPTRHEVPLSPPIVGAFSALGLGAVVVAFLTPWFGLSAIWWSVALAMLGTLAIARLMPLHRERVDWARSLGELVRQRRFWAVVLVGLCVNLCWHFLVNWLPTYLQDDRKMAFLKGGLLSAVPFLAADAGNLLGGGLTRILARRGIALAPARFRVMALSATLASAGAWVSLVRNDAAVMVLLAVMALGAAAYMANNLAACQEVDARHTGLVVGLQGGLGNLFVAGSLPIAGKVKDVTHGFGAVFAVVSLLPLVGLAALAWGWRKPPANGPDPSRPEVGTTHAQAD